MIRLLDVNNPQAPQHYDLCVQGNSPQSFQIAINRAMAGDHVALVHTKKTGDQDFSFKDQIVLQSLYASAQSAHNMRIADKLGISSVQPEIKWNKVQANIRDTLGRIAPHYSFERLKALGVHVIEGPVQDETISAKETIIEEVPPNKHDYEGLDKIEVQDISSIANWDALPEHLIIIGGNGLAITLAQSLLRLGCKTSVVAPTDILEGLDRELYKIVFDRFEYEGIRLIQNADITKIDKADKIIVHMMHEEAKRRVSGSHLLILPEDNSSDGIYALAYPSVAQVGLSETAAREKFGSGNFHMVKWRYQECDFAASQHNPEGLMKVITKMDGTVIGAGICGSEAQELIMPWSLAINNKLKIANMQDLSSSYSSYSRMTTLSVDGYISQISNPARLFKSPGSFWQSLIGGGG